MAYEDESEYLAQLAEERHLYKWCLMKYAVIDCDSAEKESIEFYPYEETEVHIRGLVFHDEAWHWAMLRVYGENYWVKNPGLEKPSIEYENEYSRYQAERPST
jgi:hypothetical protein